MLSPGLFLKKNAVLLCLLASFLFFLMAIQLYPGGSLQDVSSKGFVWSKNFISNLFQAKAINGAENPGRIWAMIGIAFHSLGYGIFFINMSQKIPNKQATLVLKLVGYLDIFFNFLIATPLHDVMIPISSSATLIGLFYITVFLLKTKLNTLKIVCIAGMLLFYFTLYLYGAGDWGLLAIMQKVSMLYAIALILVLEYFTAKPDFLPIIPNSASDEL